jgi:hypothetical protein
MCFLYFSLFIEATDLLQKLSLDTQTKTLEIPEPTKKVIFSVVYVIDWSNASNFPYYVFMGIPSSSFA